MIDPELVAKIRLLFFAEHWKIGTIATQLNLHRDTVCAALETDRFHRPKQDRTARKTDPYVDFIRQTLTQYPRLRSTRIFQMIRARGYEGGPSQLRRLRVLECLATHIFINPLHRVVARDERVSPAFSAASEGFFSAPAERSSDESRCHSAPGSSPPSAPG